MAIQELHVVVEVTLFLKVLNLWTKLLRVEKNLCADIAPKIGLFWSIILSKILLSVGPFFTVLIVTLLFLVRFLPVKYRIKAFDMLYSMVRGKLIKSCSWPGQGLGQTWSTRSLVKLGQTFPNLEKCAPGYV